MNKKILAASAVLAAVSMSFAMDTWVGANSEYRVETGFDDGTDTYGYWYDYNDNKETADNGPGTSTITWPTAKGNAYSAEAMDPIIDMCGGVCGTATMGGPYLYPFVGVGFNLSGGDQGGNDISSWGGICIGYKSTGIAPALEIAPADEGTVTGYNNYKASLKIQASEGVVDLPWTSFKQEASWGTKVDQSVVLASAAAIKFKIAAADGKSTEFNISTIGELGKCSGAAIKSTAAASSVKASVAGRTLALSGVNAGATVEVINLQGQVVLKSVLNASSASLNLASFDAGVYMVRVAGKANFSQKIVLK
ncbi:MAG: T9SS type A sorting domain-containing protein [Fibrobacter sp.]|jgi:hypothetical protein|nr:T9SS type A sorting domain-containing protein [Fibrobacter sp.]MDY6369760.1 T9SS type A sorting domain-containing protein [Fibrobacter sp.]MDY6390610.1 T9SS type A sorting domain-containing protein [Fibrobacter sp.]